MEFAQDGLEQFVALTPHAMAMLDREMRFVAASPRWLADFGLTASPIGRSLYAVCPGAGAAWTTMHARVLAGAVERRGGERFEGADGVVRWIESETRPWRTLDGAIGGIVVAATDITARVEAEERAEALAHRLENEARRAEATQRRIEEAIDVLPAGFDLYDADDRLVVSNAAAAAMYPHTVEARRPGISFEDLLRVGVELRIHGSEPADNERWLRERMERHRNPAGPIDQLTADGRWLRIEERGLSDGGVLVIRSDVTDIKARERELAERTAVLEATLRNMGEGIAVFGPDLRLLASNDVARRVLQLPAALVEPGTSFEDVARFRAERGDFGKDDVESQVARHIGRFRAQKPWSDRRRRRDGRIFEIRFNPTPDGGGIFMVRDVTDRASQDATLARRTTLLESTLENMGEGLAAFDADRRLLIVNETAVRLLDMPPALCRTGASFDEDIRLLAERGDFGDVDVEAFVAEGAGWFRASKPLTLTRRRRDGRTIDTRFNPTSDGGAIFLVRDVTERVEYERKLAERTALLEATLENMGEGIAVFDAYHRLLIGNANFVARLLDAPPELVRPGALLEDLVRLRAERGDYGGMSAEAVADAREAAFRAGRPLLTTARTPDGRTIDSRVSPMPGGGVVVVFRDVTERQEAEDTLRASEEGFRLLIEEAPDAILLYDVDQDRHVAANAAAERLFGVPRAELLKHGPVIHYASQQPDGAPAQQSHAAHNRRALAGEQVVFERRIRRPSDEERLCRVTLVRLESKVHLLRTSYVDVTDQVAAEAELSEVLRNVVDRQEAERRRIARELHDSLGQYLAAMTMKLSALDANAADPLTVKAGIADLKGLTATVGDEVHRLAWELRPTALDDLGLGPAIQRYVEEWAARSGVTCDVHLALKDRRLPADVETTLYRVLQEALTNVLRHARARRVGIVLKASPDIAVMIIEDDGVGFDQERAAASSRLGLRGMRERLAAIRGSLEIESAPDGGTSLIIRVPLRGSAAGFRSGPA